MTEGEPAYRIKLDWLNLVLPMRSMGKAFRLVNRYLGTGEGRDYGMHFYRLSHAWETGTIAAWTPGREDWLLSINGDSCDMIPRRQLRRFMRSLHALGAHGTRVDVAFDDFTGELLRMEDVHAAADARNFLRYRVEDGGQRPKRCGELIGDSRTFGVKGKDGGGRQVIVYDKALESNGQVDSIRLEARFFKEFAGQVFESLASSFDDASMVRKMRELVGGAIDFVERGEHRHTARMPRLPWWQRVLDVLGRAVLRVDQVVPPLQRTAEYAKRAWLPSLALVVDVISGAGEHDGESVILELLRDARRKLGNVRQGARDLGIDVLALMGVEVAL